MHPLNPQTRSRLEAVFREVFDDDSLQLTDALDRESLRGWDSLGHIRLVSSVEEVFGVSFTLEEIESMVSVPKIVELLDSRF
jgi:acyl carrier protein